MDNQFSKNLIAGIEFEDFIHNSGIIRELFPIKSYSDTRNHTLEDFKGPRLYGEDNKDYELPDFQLYTPTGIIWLEAKSKQSGSFSYKLHGKADQYFSLDSNKFNSYRAVIELTYAYDLYFIFGDMQNGEIYLYRWEDYTDFAWLNMSKNNPRQYCPLFLKSKKFLVAEITDYTNNEFRRIK